MTRSLSYTLFTIITLSSCGLMAQVSPEVLPDGRVTFRITAPEAHDVKVRGQWSKEPVPLAAGDKGLWEGTTPQPVQPGIWEYGFDIDDLRTIDSRNPDIKPQRWPRTSILHINSDPPAHWDLQHIPHGAIHLHDYYARTLNKWRRLAVYTPAHYQKTQDRLPVLYLAHGFSDNQDAWAVHGHANTIMDSLINQNLAKPMLIVMPDAHPIDPEDTTYEEYRDGNTRAFAEELLNDVIPFVESNYKVQEKTSGRAFAGLSMGGGHAFTLAFEQHDKFSWIGGFSSSTPTEDYIRNHADVSQMNKDLKLFWVACGDQDFLYERNQQTHATMNSLGIRHEYVITPGDNHSWPVWRHYLIDFASKLFQD